MTWMQSWVAVRTMTFSVRKDFLLQFEIVYAYVRMLCFCRASLSSVSLSKFAVTKFAKSLNKTMFPKCVSDSLVSTVMRFIWISSGTHLRHLSILGTGGQPTPKHHSSVDCIYCKRCSNLVTAAGQDLLTSATNAQLGIVCC